MGAELFHEDGATNGRTADMGKLIVAFRSFAYAPKNYVNVQERINEGVYHCSDFKNLCCDYSH